MAIDEGLSQRVRETLLNLADFADISERRMFGGNVTMVNGHMTCGVGNNGLMLRVGARQHAAALARDFARPMDFTGRPMKGFIYVDPEGLEDDHELAQWLQLSLDFVLSQPPK